MKKYRVSTTNVPISLLKFVLETKFVPLSSKVIRCLNGQTSKMAENEDWVRLAKPVHIAQNQSRP